MPSTGSVGTELFDQLQKLFDPQSTGLEPSRRARFAFIALLFALRPLLNDVAPFAPVLKVAVMEITSDDEPCDEPWPPTYLRQIFS